MCKTFAIKDDNITLLGYVNKNVKNTPNTPRIRANTISFHSDASKSDTSKSVEETYSDLMNNLNYNMEDPDDFFGIKLSDSMDIIEENQEIQEDQEKSNNSNDKPEDEITIEEPKKKTDLQKICGFQSYQHIIEKAIYCSEEKMLTLNQIYNWVEENVPYFRDLSKNNKSKCWKNAIRHNLSLHKQFYKVLREGHRSCLWAVDKSRIIKGEKTKKAAPILPPSFRQRSQTDPISMKAVKNFISENSGKKTEAKFYDPLISQINSISSGNSSVEILPQDPIINDSYSSPSSNSSSGLSWNYEQANKNAYVPNIQSWNYEQPQNDYTPNYDCFTVSPSTMELDYQAIIEHERHLYEADYPRY